MAGTYTVEKGDTLWGIAEKHLGSGSKYKQLATINNIPNPNLIYVGQVIKLSSDGSSSSSSSSSSSNTIKIKQFGLQSDADNTLFATWTWGKEKTTASYKVQWTYDTGDGVWWDGRSSSITVDKDDRSLSRQDKYNIPNNALRVRFKVKPVAETKKDKKGNESALWTQGWSETKMWTVERPLGVPSSPSVKIEKYQLTTTLDNIKVEDATHIIFQIVKDNSSKTLHESKPVVIETATASYTYKVATGSEYKVRCCAYSSKDKRKSEWSDYSSNVGTIPATPSGDLTIRASSETSVYLAWPEVGTATSYKIEYTTKKEYFDGSDKTTTKSGIEFTHFEITDLETGNEYFFRVCATNSEGDSGWTEPVSIVIGTDPAAPTTWSSTTTAIAGVDSSVTLYWIHNSEDGSKQMLAELKLIIGDTENVIEFNEPLEDDEIGMYEIDTSAYSEGTKIQWQVRTAGITSTFSEWSVLRTVDIYAPPTLELDITDVDGNEISTITEFPFFIKTLAGPKTQVPVGYHVAIISNEYYETTDNIGNFKTVNVDEQVYSKYFDTRDALLVALSANNIDLENGITYTVTCVVSMNSGLTAEESKTFTVSWTDTRCEPNAEIGIDNASLTASIRPYCENTKLVYREVVKDNRTYTVTDQTYDFMSGEVVKNAKTTTGEQVYTGVTEAGDEIYYCTVEESTPVTDVYLSVYRREYDGSFTELATGLDGGKSTTITDPHPALDYARYRIVATSKATGAVSYYDPPGYPINGAAVIIQWNEDWSSFDATEDTLPEQPTWSGSLLRLPYNIDVSDSNSPDIELVEYIGRSHPLSYYGTQLGTSATWNMVIEKSDTETLYALRRLARWMGDVYVREPSGSGYWANITVSFSQKHCDLTIPVTMNITRVEGGV